MTTLTPTDSAVLAKLCQSMVPHLDRPAPRESVAGTFASIEAHLEAQMHQCPECGTLYFESQCCDWHPVGTVPRGTA